MKQMIEVNRPATRRDYQDSGENSARPQRKMRPQLTGGLVQTAALFLVLVLVVGYCGHQARATPLQLVSGQSSAPASSNNVLTHRNQQQQQQQHSGQKQKSDINNLGE